MRTPCELINGILEANDQHAECAIELGKLEVKNEERFKGCIKDLLWKKCEECECGECPVCVAKKTKKSRKGKSGRKGRKGRKG